LQCCYTAFGIQLDKGVIKHVLDKTYHPSDNNHGPSWLTFLGNLKDSLWSVDFFRLESTSLKSHWIMLIMDQFSRRIIGFAIYDSDLNGTAICHMFNSIISHKSLPKFLSSDNDPLFQFHKWQANLRILDIKEIKSVTNTPISHPFIERLIGTIRREFTDNILFWNKRDLSNKLREFKTIIIISEHIALKICYNH
jgi:putative transposase